MNIPNKTTRSQTVSKICKMRLLGQSRSLLVHPKHLRLKKTEFETVFKIKKKMRHLRLLFSTSHETEFFTWVAGRVC